MSTYSDTSKGDLHRRGRRRWALSRERGAAAARLRVRSEKAPPQHQGAPPLPFIERTKRWRAKDEGGLEGRRLFRAEVGHLRARQAHEVGCLQPDRSVVRAGLDRD
jgi:hypothetical protein